MPERRQELRVPVDMPVVLHMLVVDGIQSVLQGRQFFIGATIGLGIEDILDCIPNMDKRKHLLFQFRGFGHDSIDFLAPSFGQIFLSQHFPFGLLIPLLADNGIPHHLLMDKALEILRLPIDIMVDHLAIFIGIAKTAAGLCVFLHRWL